MSENNPKVWADGFGIWHCSVPLTGSAQRDAREARRLILAELEQREAPYRVIRLRVTREHVTNHGTAIYGEV